MSGYGLRLRSWKLSLGWLTMAGMLFQSFASGWTAEPRCELIPEADRSVSFLVDGQRRVAWHGLPPGLPRPFVYPLIGPSGRSLTRMGHPGAPNHDHHRSIWFAHHDVNGLDFWSDTSAHRIRQQQWYAMQDGPGQAVLAVALTWEDEEGQPQLNQDTVISLLPQSDGGVAVEFQLELSPPEGRSQVRLGQTNFGILAVRVAKTISAHFGGGQLTSSEGGVGEAEIFGRNARWVDYSGLNPSGVGAARKVIREGVTYFDHPANPRYPSHWHVREDGWMGASLCYQEPLVIEAGQPLVLRYLLVAHLGAYDTQQAEQQQAAFATSRRWVIARSDAKHVAWQVARAAE